MNKFDSDIPIPAITRGTTSQFEGIKVGQSLVNPHWKSQSAALQQFNKWAANHCFGAKGVTRKMTENGVKVIRLWRTE